MKAIFLGNFNPANYGHLTCVDSVLSNQKVMDLYNIDEIYVIPYKNLSNEQTEFTTFELRYNMTKSLFDEIDKVVVSDIMNKYNLEDITSLINKLKELLLFSDNFVWIITEEKVINMIKNNEDYLLKNNKFIILFDKIEPSSIIWKDERINPDNRIFLRTTNPIKVRSSEIRKKVNNNEDVSDLTFNKVKNIIKDNNLFKK